jgi:hypothetical protein
MKSIKKKITCVLFTGTLFTIINTLTPRFQMWCVPEYFDTLTTIRQRPRHRICTCTHYARSMQRGGAFIRKNVTYMYANVTYMYDNTPQ